MNGIRITLLVLVVLEVPGFAAAPPAIRRDQFGDPLPPGAIARLGSMRLRHLSDCPGLAVSPDGSRIATQGETIRIWDRVSGRLLREFHRGGALCGEMSFTPDGKKLFSAHFSLKTPFLDMRTFDLDTGKEEKFWAKSLDRGTVEKIAFSGDGAWLAILYSGFAEDAFVSHLRLFDLVKKKEHHLVTEKGLGFSALAFSHDSRQLLVPDYGGLQIWDVGSRKKVSQIKIPIPSVHAFRFALAVSPDGKTVAVQEDRNSLTIIRPGPNPQVTTVGGTGSDMLAIQFSPNGKELFIVSGEGGIIAVDPATGKRSRVVMPATDCSSALGCLSADGRWLVLYGDAAMQVVDARTGKRQHSFDDHRDYDGVEATASPDGRKVATRSTRELRIWDMRSGKNLCRISGEDFIPGLSWSKDGKHVVVASGNDLGWWDASTGKRVRTEPLPSGTILHAALLSCGKRASCLFHKEKHPPHFAILDLTQKSKQIYNTPTEDDRVSPRVSVDGKRALTLSDSEEGTLLRVLNPLSGKTLWQRNLQGQLHIFPEPEIQAVFSPDGERVAVLTKNETRIHDAVSGRTVGLAAVGSESGFTSLLGMSPDGRTLILKENLSFKDILDEWDKTTEDRVYLVEVATGQVRHTLPVLPRIGGGHFSRDGRHLITASHDGTALVWDLNAQAAPSSLWAAWDDLASADARKGFAAISRLAASPQKAVEILREKLKPALIDVKQVRLWIADLGSEAFQRRSEAEMKLAELGSEDELLQALERTKELEVHLRLRRLLARLRANSRQTRSLEVLERIGSPEAVRLVKRLADGHSGSRLTREATETLQRLQRK